MLAGMAEMTQILARIEKGEQAAAEELLPLVYDELRMLAAANLAREKPGQTLQATALVHEAYLKLVDNDSPSSRSWKDRRHFFAAAAQAMRRILMDNARRKARVKHGGDRRQVPLNEFELTAGESPETLLLIHDALDRLAGEDPTAAEVVHLCYFAGLTVEQVARCSGGFSRNGIPPVDLREGLAARGNPAGKIVGFCSGSFTTP